ncbi:uncharacterized protein LOC143450437 isoform X3 [Clavelina lepadiformis]|uniref:uncharacterized protein LOC143450437 isoform X3 n=2 Tax=Clavelina lepadiformis TaxID=159417 RepID=UPI00404332A0
MIFAVECYQSRLLHYFPCRSRNIPRHWSIIFALMCRQMAFSNNLLRLRNDINVSKSLMKSPSVLHELQMLKTMTSLVKIFVATFSFFTVASAECTGDWIQNGDRCYYISSSNAATLSWHEADSKCRSMRSNLAVVNDEIENTFLYTQFELNKYYYIGLHDLNEENAWQWVDGSSLTYTAWAAGQPDNYGDAIGGQEDCVEMVWDQGGLWNDLACSIRRNFICERSADLDPDPNCQESDGWAEYNGRCYKVIDNRVPWVAADADCKSMAANLVAITSENEQLFVSNKVNEWNQHMWLGLSSVDHTSNDLYWSNGVDSLGYTHWAPGEPTLDASASNCVGVDPGISTNGLWSVERCGNGHSYMCETALTGSCPVGWYMYNSVCYFQATAENAWTTWLEAKDICEAMGAKLLKIEDSDKQNYINTRLPDIRDGGSTYLWLGLSDSDSDGTFTWTDGSVVSPNTFTNWATNQPRDQKAAWDCGQVYTGSSKWETDDCFKKQAFFCEIPAGQDVKPVTPVANLGQGCDPGWRYFNDHCYYFEYDKELTWQDARQQCTNAGADLVSILTGEENAFVTSHAYGTTWIGANDLELEGTFKWSDGLAWSFADWQSGEPNGIGGNSGDADCVTMWQDVNYKWDDNQCDKKWRYVCKAVPHDCDQALGMEDRTILDGEVTASSMWDSNHAPYLGRLNNKKDGGLIGAWAPSKTADGQNPLPGSTWIQVHLIPERTVTAITTQGRPEDYNQYVKSYQIAYSDDGNNFQFVKSGSDVLTFTGNVDSYTPVTNRLPTQIVTSYIRLYPRMYQEYPTLRMEILGCTSEGASLSTPSPDPECTAVPINERVDCGYPGIGGTNCVAKGCCWDNTVSGVKWCFYQKDRYDPRCGKDWSFDPSGEFYCYHFNDYTYRNWQQAREYCQGIGGDLLSINSKSEAAYVSGQVSTLVLSASLWTGGNNLDSNAGWKWSNGQPFNYISWATGEPNGYDSGENCVELYTADGVWNDLYCDWERGIACKKFATIAPPTTDDDGNIKVDICEGETGDLICTGNTMIVVHHASYGRSNARTCGEGNVVPPGGCHSVDSLDIVSDACNYKSSCSLSALNEIFDDPCPNTYKYLNVIFSCESKGCYSQLGVENGTVSDSQITESSSIDGNHRGNSGRLNGDRSWATNEGVGAWVQVTFPTNVRITGFIVQGANDAERYVTSFTVQFADDNTFMKWSDYTDYDGNIQTFSANADTSTPVEVIMTEHVFTPGVRILPIEWQGDMIGMRFDVTGCNPTRALECSEIGDLILLEDDADGTAVMAECPGFCPQVTPPSPIVYGTGIYAGNSQICNAAVHAGVIIDRFGGPVTVVKKPKQSTYKGTDRNNVVSQDYDYYPVAFAFADNVKNCQAGWVPYGSSCYWISDFSLTWAEAEAFCVEQGGHLVTIPDSVDQDFVFQQLAQSNFTDIWIGLNDLRSTYEYEWADGEQVTYTNWARQEPNNYEGKSENCVEMYRDTESYRVGGTWNDALCSDVTGFVCKKFKSYYTGDEAADPTPPPGCDKDWLPYEGYCYWFRRQMVTETDAENFCENLGGVTVHVRDKYVQSFLHTVIGAEDQRWWIGLHAEVSDETGITWHWESGDPVTYDNWGRSNPNINNGECTVFYGGNVGSGMWYSTRCEKQAYTICELPRDGWTPPPPTTPPPVGGCYYDWSTPDSSSPYCYKVFAPEASGNFDQKQSWDNAYHQCLASGGDLVSIHSKTEETFLLDQLKNFGVIAQYAWIGLNNKAETDWLWSDNSAVEYINWNPGSPSSSQENNCVAMKYDPSSEIGTWDNLNCREPLDWICMMAKGVSPPPVTEAPTGVVDTSCGDTTEGTWVKYDGLCYFFSNNGESDFYTGQRFCLNAGGELLSIHSNVEQSFITNQIKPMGQLGFWCGLKERGGVNGQYSWTDDTVLDYVNWNSGEPNNAWGTEQCVTVSKDDGKWNDGNCGLKLHGFICKKYPGSPPNPPQPTQPAPGACPADWLVYNNGCYQLHGDKDICDPAATDDVTCFATWVQAHDKCDSLGGYLVTINTKYENAFLTAQTARAINNLWIGMSDIQWSGGRYTWANGDEVLYTNWNDGEPNHNNGEENCAEMYLNGRWNDVNCEGLRPFFCGKDKDPGLSDGMQLNKNEKCKDGWMQFDAENGGYSCFYLDATMRPFEEARQVCQGMGADVANLQTEWEQAFVTSYVMDTSVWLGLVLNSDTFEWSWVDNWPVWYTNWGEMQPGSDVSMGCVINQDSQYGSEWLTENCNTPHMTLCKSTSEVIPPTPGYVDGYCEDPSWHEYGGFCYFFSIKEGNPEYPGVAWNDAEVVCTGSAGNLASFTSRAEIEWMLDWFNYTEAIWIGLRDNEQGGFSWTDNRPVAFTNWNSGEPNNAGDEDCVEMYGDSGKWNDINCSDLKGYMCRVPKVVGTDENGNVIHYTTTAKPESNPVNSNNAAIIAGSVIGALVAIFVVLGIALYCSRSTDPGLTKLKEDVVSIPSGFVNKLYDLAGTAPSTSSAAKSDPSPVHYEKETGATVDDSNA